MLSPRLTNCPECANIPSLLKKIDCKLAELGNNLYNNISYMLNKPVPSSDILQLIGYRRILMHKYCNPNYVHEYSVQMIASRVIRLTLGCVSKCNELERCLEEPCDIKIVPNPTTTSTSTLPITTTTSTSSTTSTTTTAVPTTTTTSSSSTSTTTSTSSTTTTSTSSSTTTTTTTICQDCIPVSFTNPNTGNGVTTLPNGLVITTTYVGPSIDVSPIPRNPYTNCAGFLQSANSLFLEWTNWLPYTLTIDFSYPVNNIYILNAGMGYNQHPGEPECFVVNTDQGLPTLTTIGGCQIYEATGNVICGTFNTGGAGGATQVSTSTPFTQLVITQGDNMPGLAGFSFDLCFPNCTTTTTTTVTCPNCVEHDVTIGTQIWTGCNLNVTTFRNGDTIPEVTDIVAWYSLTTPAWCYYDNDPANEAVYGKLYNWYAINDPRGLAPIGYHIPTDSEFNTLSTFLGGDSVSGGELKQTTTCHWLTPNTGATDSSGFTALPGGYRNYASVFDQIKIQGRFWTADGVNSTDAYICTLFYNNTTISHDIIPKVSGGSVRLIKDTESTTTSSTSSTTTTSTTLSPEECVALILAVENVYTYDVITNTSVNRGAFGLSNDIANTATKMWIMSSFIEEYNITVFPWASAFNRNIAYNTQLATSNGLCAIDDVTLITTNSLVGYPHPIISLDISGSTAVETIIGYLPMNTFVTGDFIYTTTGKLIVTTSVGVGSGGPYIIQYDYATMNLEVQSTIPFYNAFGLMEANNNLYVIRGTGQVYQVDLNYPYGLTLVQNTGLTNTAGSSQTPACCNVNLIPQSSSTTTTSSSSTTTSSTSSTTSTTTTLAPSGFNTIYTTFEAL